MNLPIKNPQPNMEEQEAVPKAVSSSPGGEPQLDRWFDEQLTQLFKNVINEPMPDDLSALIGKLKAQEDR